MSDRTKTRLLTALKTSGPQTAADLAKGQSVTAVAARQHLDSLQQEGVVEFRDVKSGVGRPKRIWRLTSAGHQQFPDNHSRLILSLLDGLRSQHGEAGVEALITHREREMQVAYTQAVSDQPDLEAKLQALAELRSSEGYMAEVLPVEGEASSFLLIENHCSICAAASACQGFCRSEMRLFQDVLGDGVELQRTEHLLSGNHRCVYKVRQKNLAAA
ncbi:transcriptional regulator [Roseibium sp. CAU 1637]|uniref:Transcriptional regulator n=2 Tax=Roseibium TaxID=150830 RepID=A0A939EK71_9HYPH|nr:metalloregulator ArsR/SmtB family transcription factor [Roseibium limicola]MBO0343740.1 transcriptional regulator [Roseibium limicola]